MTINIQRPKKKKSEQVEEATGRQGDLIRSQLLISTRNCTAQNLKARIVPTHSPASNSSSPVVRCSKMLFAFIIHSAQWPAGSNSIHANSAHDSIIAKVSEDGESTFLGGYSEFPAQNHLLRKRCIMGWIVSPIKINWSNFPTPENVTWCETRVLADVIV